MSSSRRTFYEFDEFRVDTVRRLLLCDGETVPLTPKIFDLLLTLIEHRRQVLTKEELLRKVWPEVIVEESNLTQNIFMLRKTLGETPSDHRYIVTVRGKGYRFVSEVREVHEDATDRTPQSDYTGLARSGDKAISIAVLPFKNLHPKDDDEYLGAGLASSLIARLNQLRLVAARPTASVLKYSTPGYSPQVVGQELRVSAVLDGTIQRVGDRIRVNVELVRVQDGNTLWASHFDANFTDIFNVQDSISEQVVSALHVELTGEEQTRLTDKETDNIEAYRLYIKGRYFWDQRTASGLQKGIEYAERALAIDPHYVKAHIGVADSYALLAEYLYSSPFDAFPKSRQSALLALELDNTLAEAHASLAEVSFFFEWDWAKAEEEYRRACELNPYYASAHHWYAWFLITQKRFDEALTEIQLAQRLDPGSLPLAAALGLPFYFRREYRLAVEQYRETLEMNPNFILAHYYLGLALLQLGQYGEAISSLNKVKAVEYTQQVLAYLGYAYGRLGRRSEALRVMRDLQRMKQRGYVSPYIEAIIYAGLNETLEALTHLEHAFQKRATWMVFLQVEPCFEQLRAEPRFRELLRQLWS
jgi:DNA-binding winged helix-turn-helix (wHTH) protein/tetratricopeptide (TPR) repeat protein